MARTFSVSTSAVDITPPAGFPMGGYGVDIPRLATGTNEPLRARCTIFWDAGTPKVIVTADVLAFGRTMHQAVRAGVVALGVASPDFVLTATHTHNGPVLIEKLNPYIAYNLTDLTEVEAYCDELVDTLVQLVRTTLRRRRTRCTLDYQVTDENFSFNREGLPYTEVDVPVLVARTLAGIPRAVLFGYGAHTVAASGQTEFDPDYPAQAIKEIEAVSDKIFAQFMLGPAGDQNPRITLSFESSDAYGEDLGLTVANAIEQPGRRVFGPIRTEYTEIEIPLDFSQAASNLALVRTAYLSRAQRPGMLGFFRRHAEEMIRDLDAGTFETSVMLPIQVWTLSGDPELKVVFCGGEVVSGYAVVLRDNHGGSNEVWFNAYANEVPAYIPSTELLSRPSYAGGIDMDAPAIAGGSMTVYDHVGHFSRGEPGTPDGVERILLTQLQSMVSSVSNDLDN